jgi:hypothetical protein
VAVLVDVLASEKGVLLAIQHQFLIVIIRIEESHYPCLRGINRFNIASLHSFLSSQNKWSWIFNMVKTAKPEFFILKCHLLDRLVDSVVILF